MNAFAKLKLTGELNTLKADMAAMGALQKLKATKRVSEISVLLGGNQMAQVVKDDQVLAKINDVRTALYSSGWSGIKDGSGELVKNGFSAFLLENQERDNFFISIKDGVDHQAEIGGGMTKSVDKLIAAVNEVVQDNSKEPETYVRAEILPDEIANLTRLFPILTKFVEYAADRGFHAVIGWGGARASAKKNGADKPEVCLNIDGDYKDKIVVQQYIDGNYHVFAIYAATEGNFSEAFDGAEKQTPADEPVEPASNPLYQSVIDGTEVTTSLIEQVLEQAKTEADPASNAQLTQAVEIIRKKVIELAGA